MTEHERLQKLEENQAFAEHAVEQLNSELTELSRRLLDTAARLDKLEQRMDALAGTVTDLAEGGGDEPTGESPPSVH